jgi:hypothetical protein
MKGGINQVPIILQYLLLTYELLIQIWQILFVFYLEQRNHILIQNLNFKIVMTPSINSFKNRLDKVLEGPKIILRNYRAIIESL